MDAVLFGRYFLEFALLYPGAYLCLAPLRDHLKAPKTTCWIAGGALTALCLGCAALCTIFELPSNVFLLPILIVSFWLLRWRTEGVTVGQTAFLFSVSAVMLAVCSLMAVVLNARAETGNQQEANLVSTALLALGLSAVLSVLFHFTAVRWSAWLLQEYHGEAFWQSAWPLPAIYAAFLIFCIPLDPSVVLLNRIMIIAVLAGYALSRYYRKRIVKASNFMMMLSQMIPGVLLLVPLYMIMQQMHMLETHISLVLAYTTFVIPLCTFMMSSFFDTVPIDLEEAAEIDGCSKAKTLIRVILPVSIPSLISTGLYAFINAWNEFMFGYVLISSDKLRTLTPAIMLFKGANLVDWGGLMAASVISVLPVTIIFLFLQKYFLAGLMSGSVKG